MGLLPSGICAICEICGFNSLCLPPFHPAPPSCYPPRMPLHFQRHPDNPIVTPGLYDWRMAVTFNPGVLLDDDGRFYMYERTAGTLRPFHCYIGMLESDDGVHFRHTVDHPVFTPEMAGSRYGSVQDPRVTKLDGRYCMTYAFRPYAWASSPTGVGVPESHQVDYPGFSGRDEDNQTRSGIAVSTDRVNWKHLSWVSDPGLDDRNVILFPDKIRGRYAALRRPQPFVGTDTAHAAPPDICISYSDDLLTWTPPEPVLSPRFPWEDNRIGGSTPPIRTPRGWLVFYHGVQNLAPDRPELRRVCYRLGVALLDLDDPTRVLARTPEPVMQPEAYYERSGLYIPNVIFPTAALVKEGTLHLYYGCCDTAIALATAPLDQVVDHVLKTGSRSQQPAASS